MSSVSRMSFAVEGFTLPKRSPRKSRQSTKARAREIVAHMDAAIARKSGRDITDLTDEELVADLIRHRNRD